jgi:hypothetical protein
MILNMEEVGLIYEIMEELSGIDKLNTLGIPCPSATTNDPDVRINSVRYILNQMIDGEHLSDRVEKPGEIYETRQ